jgi:protein O-GlcNAc transferase
MAAITELEIKAGWDLYRRGDWAGAERCCQKVMAVAPSHGGALGLLGILRLTAGRADEAAALLMQALKSKPRDAMLLGGLGLARLMQADAPGAEQALRSALKWGNRDDALLHMRLGMALGAQGRTAEAITELKRASALAPDNPEAMLNLANALAESGQAAEAENLLRRVLTRKPDHGDARFNLGTLYTRLGRLDEAVAEFRKLLTHYPDNADAHNNLGIVLERQAQWEAAAEAYRKALTLEGNHLSALNNLGNVLRSQRRAEEAAEHYARAMNIAPAHADGYLNMGMLRAGQNQLKEASEWFRKALAVDPLCLEAAINLGEALRQTGALADAMNAFRKALSIDSGSVIALNGLGNLLRMQSQLGEAAECYLRAMRAAPQNPDGFLNLGVLRAQQGQFDEACVLLRQAVKVDSSCTPAQFKLAEALKVSGRLDESKAVYQQLLLLQPENIAACAGLAHVRQHLCEWDGIEALWEDARRAIRDGEDTGITPFSALSIPTTGEEQLACASAWAHREFGWISDQYASGKRAAPLARPLRLGYLSWDYHQHATAYLMAEVFELHDRDRFSVTAYSFGPDDGSAIRHRIQDACDAFVDVAALSDAAAARRIADDGIDILIDLKGYTLGSRTAILAYRPAPVQVNWLGFPGTMGTHCIDWIFADPFIIPEGADKYYSERVYRLPDCYQPNDRRREIAAVPTRADCGLPEAGVVFCCFNQPYKILPETFSAWTRILCRVPDSVLWLLETNPMAMQNLRLNAAAHGVAAERIIFAPHRPLAAHLARYRIADLALDTFPYTSHTTASDALWAGCPLVARAGDTFASRVSGSVLHAAQMPELVAHTMEAFEELAVQIALDPDRCAGLRRRLHEGRMTFPLFDTPRFVQNLERAYHALSQEL